MPGPFKVQIANIEKNLNKMEEPYFEWKKDMRTILTAAKDYNKLALFLMTEQAHLIQKEDICDFGKIASFAKIAIRTIEHMTQQRETLHRSLRNALKELEL
jgi:hypothetical protein